ncbi:MAG: hypothetical protein ACYDD0_12290, partial [Candidatus Dormibacteria bacterium]
LFGPEPERRAASSRPNYSERARRRLACGLHPLMGTPVLADSWASCGKCSHLYTGGGHARGYLKCDQLSTGSEATDVRRWWPGCQLWEASGSIGDMAAGGHQPPAAGRTP